MNYTAKNTPPIIVPILLGIGSLISLILTILFIRYEYRRLGGWSAVMRNKIIRWAMLMNICWIISNIFQIIRYTVDTWSPYIEASIDVCERAMFHMAAVGHAVALYLRTDSTLIQPRNKNIVRGFIGAFMLFAFCLTFYTFTGFIGPFVRIMYVIIVGCLFGLTIVIIDVTYTYCFVRYVLVTRKVLGKDVVRLTELIAYECPKMSGMSIVTLSLFVIAQLLVPMYSMAFWVTMTMMKLGSGTLCLLWMRLKYRIDETMGDSSLPGSQKSEAKPTRSIQSTTATPPTIENPHPFQV